MIKPLKHIVASLFALPLMLQASGVGVYIPYSFGDSSSLALDNSNLESDIDYKSAVGFGLVYDTNVGNDTLFNYRLGLERLSLERDGFNGPNFTQYNIVNTFGFGVVRTNNIRLWVGPRIILGVMSASGDGGYSETSTEFGFAPAVGLNYNLSSSLSLGVDLDYKWASVAGSYLSDSTSEQTYTGTTTGMNMRFSIMYRFGETFDSVDNTYNDL